MNYPRQRERGRRQFWVACVYYYYCCGCPKVEIRLQKVDEGQQKTIPQKLKRRLFGVRAVCGCRLGKNEPCNTIYDDEGKGGGDCVESAIIDVRGVDLAARKKKTPSKKSGSGKDGPKKDPWR